MSKYCSTKENYTENKVGRALQSLYGEDILYLKLAILGTRGFPDRLILWNYGVMFVEFKREGERPRKLQCYYHGILRSLGFEVQVHDNYEHAMGAITSHIKASGGTSARHGTDSTRGGS